MRSFNGACRVQETPGSTEGEPRVSPRSSKGLLYKYMTLCVALLPHHNPQEQFSSPTRASVERPTVPPQTFTMTFVPGIYIFSFHHNGDPRQYHDRSKSAESSKQRTVPEPRSTLRPEVTLQVAEPEQSVLRQTIERFGKLCMIACIFLGKVVSIIPTASLRFFLTKINKYLRTAAWCVW